LQVAGTIALGTGLAVPGTVSMNDIESRLGRVSVRVGANFVSQNLALQPFFTGSLFREFAGNVTSDFDRCAFSLFGGPLTNPALDGHATMKTSRVGTYAQLGLGIAAQIIDTDWLGYARVDYRTGDNVEGLSFNAGIRYQFNPTPDQGLSLKDGRAGVIGP